MKTFYLDHAASTPLAAEVAAAMAEVAGQTGNASSQHAAGRALRDHLDVARETVAQELGCLFGEICFTSGGTESGNLALLGLALANPSRREILVSASEHHCLLSPAPVLSRLGITLRTVRADRYGRIDLTSLQEMASDQTLAIAAMHANNELGTRNDLVGVRGICEQVGALLIVDAVQTLGRESLHGSAWKADILFGSAHKFNGPKGVGVLFVRAGTPFEALLRGGGQERDLRAGTENVSGIVGLAAALRRGAISAPVELRERLAAGLPARFMRTVPPEVPTLPGHLHVIAPGIPAEQMLIALDRRGVFASSGAACSAGSSEPSHVLLAAGYDAQTSAQGIRFSLGPELSLDDVKEAARRITEAAEDIWSRQKG